MPIQLVQKHAKTQTYRPSSFLSLYLEASGRDIWSGHPAKGGYKLEAFEGYFAFLLGTQSALEVTNINSAAIVGASAYYTLRECSTVSPLDLIF